MAGLSLLHLAAAGEVLDEDEAAAVDRPLHHFGDAHAALQSMVTF